MSKSDVSWASLAAFEATARLESMTAAAHELGSTQPAISQRIRQLEKRLGLSLFDRTERRIRLTANGRFYHEEIADSMRHILGATRRMQARASARERQLCITAPFGFAHLWLLPRLPRLEAAFPGISFEILPVDYHVKDERDYGDLKIRFGNFSDLGPDDCALIPERVYPVCSPEVASRNGLEDVLDSADLTCLPLLHMDDQDPRWLDWTRWCQLAGLAHDPARSTFQHRNYPLLLNAAVEGQGIALGWHGLIDTLIREGTLVRLAPEVVRVERGYRLSFDQAQATLIRPVRRWIERECAVTRGMSDPL